MSMKNTAKKLMSLILILMFLNMQLASLYANGIVADGTTQTSIDTAPNGTPIVNIANPNAKGLSHNKYSDFNVDPKNLIMNNSNEICAQSQLGGYINGNPNLIGKTGANVVLNEVTSNRLSNLKGYIEMHGKKADFILANPNGISVAGVGFINTPRATLVTGTPNITDGMVSSFNMSNNGIINISGRDVPGLENLGLDLQNVDYASIVSRVIKISGKIYGNTVNLLAGNDKYDYNADTISSKEGAANPEGIEFAVDSSLLGGMYAGRIRIVANEKGFGVRTRDDLIANIDDITITADGKIEYAKADAARDLKITSSNGDIVNTNCSTAVNNTVIEGKNLDIKKAVSGNNIELTANENAKYETLEANNDITVNADGAIENTDHTTAGADINLTGQSISSSNAKLLAGNNINMVATGDAVYGIAEANNNITINAGGDINNTNYTMAGTDIELTANSVSDGKFYSGNDIDITTTGDAVYEAAEANNSIKIDSGGSIKNTNYTTAATDINFTAGNIESGNASLVAGNNINMTAIGDAVYGIAEANNNINIEANGKIENTDHTTAVVDINLSGNSIDSSNASFLAGNDIFIETIGDAIYGTLEANRNISVNAGGDINNINYTMASYDIGLTGKNILAGNFYSGNDLNITAEENITYEAAEANNNIFINAGADITNTDYTVANYDLSLIGNNILDGNFYSGNNLTMTASGDAAYKIAESNNSITIDAGGNISNLDYTAAILDINLTGYRILAGNFYAGNNVNIEASSDVNYEIAEANNNISVNTDGNINNTDHTLALKDINLTVNTITSGEFTAGQDINLEVSNMTNYLNWTALRNIDFLSHANLINYGKIQSGGELRLKGNLIENNSPGYLYSGTNMYVTSGSRLDNSGIIESVENIDFDATGSCSFVGSSQTKANGNIVFNASYVDLISEVLAQGNTTINTSDGVSNRGLINTGSLNISTNGEFINKNEVKTNLGEMNIRAYRITNDSGAILHSDSSMILAASTDINNLYLLESFGDMNLTAYTLTNNSTIYSDSNMQIRIYDWLTNNYEIAAYGNLNIKANNNVTNNSSVGILANNDLTIEARDLSNNIGCYLYSGRDSLYKIKDTFYNNQAEVYSSRNMTICGLNGINSRANLIHNKAGYMSSGGSISLYGNLIENFSIDNYSSFHEPGAYTEHSEYIGDSGSWRHDDNHERQKRNEYHYSRTSNVRAVKQGKILARGNINIHGETLRNRSSIITAQNTLSIGVTNLYNERPSSDLFYCYSDWELWEQEWHDNNGNGYWGTWNKLRDEGVYTTEKLYSQTPAVLSGRNVYITATHKVYNDDPSNDLSALGGVGSGTNEVILGIQATGIVDPLSFGSVNTTVDLTGININAQNTNVQEANSNLINITKPKIEQITITPGAGFKESGPNTDYLFESSNRFLNEYEFTGSQYFIKRLGFDPVNDTKKFLGDAIYEQKLIENAIVSITGNHYIHDGISSMNDQMETLYDNAAVESKRLGFELGKELTQEEIDKLEKDVIWYIEKEVNNQIVLVPTIYLCKKTRESLSSDSRSVISGENDVRIEARDVQNTGIIKGKNTIVKANNDIANLNGLIFGKDSLSLEAGGDIENISLVQTYSGSGNVLSKITGKASIESGGILSMKAGNKIESKAANISSALDAMLSAKNINITTQELYNKTTTGSGDNKTVEESTTNVGSELNIGGNLRMETEEDTTIAGSKVNVGGSASIKTGGSLNVMSKLDTYHKETKKKREKNLGHGKVEETEIEGIMTHVGSELNIGGSLSVDSGEDINILASSVKTEKGGIDFKAGNNINILAGHNTSYRSYEKKESGNFGLKESETKEKEYKTNLASSSISSGKDFKATAGGNFNMVASNLEVKGDAEVEAEDVNIEAGIEKDDYSYYHKEKNLSDINIGALAGVGWEIKDGKASVELAKFEENEEYSGYSKETAKASNVSIGGNLKINAKRDVNVIGSDVTATETEVKAGRDINVGAKETKSTEYEGKKSTEITTSFGIGNAAVDAGMAADAAVKAGEKVKKAKDALDQAKKDPRMSKQAIKDLEANLAAASLELANAGNQALNAGVTAAGSALTFGFYASVTAERDSKENRTDTVITENRGSNISALNNVSLDAGNNINQKGSNVVALEGDLGYTAGNNVVIEASKDTEEIRNNESSSNQKMSTNTAGNFSASHSESSSSSKSYAENYNNSTAFAGGKIKIKSGNDTKIKGGNLLSTEAEIETGGDLTVESVQNTYTSEGKSEGYSMGLSSSKGGEGLNAGYNDGSSSAERKWVDNASSIETTGKLKIKTKDMKVKGAAVNSATGDLEIEASSLEVEDIENIDKSESKGFGMNVNTSGDLKDGNIQQDGNASISVSRSGAEKEGVTKATIGQGKVIVAGEEADLSGVNRDISEMQEVTKDEVTGALDVTVDSKSLDMVLNPGDTIKEAKEDLKKIGKGAVDYKQAGEDLYESASKKLGGDQGVKEQGGFFADYSNKQKLREASEKFAQNNPELTEVLLNKTEYSPEQVNEAMQKYNNYLSNEFGVENVKSTTGYKGEDLKGNTALVDGQKIDKSDMKAFYDIDNKTININESKQDGSTENLITIDGHEFAHHENAEVGEAGADRLGEQTWDAFKDEIGNGSSVNETGQSLWVEGYSSIGGFDYGNNQARVAEKVKPSLDITVTGANTLITPIKDLKPTPFITPETVKEVITHVTPAEEKKPESFITKPTPEELVVTKHTDIENGKVINKTTAEEVNKEFDSDWQPPYQQGTDVTEYETIGDNKFVRVHNGGNTETGRWLVKSNEITNPDGTLMNVEQIIDKLALPSLPTNISDVTVPEGVKIREGIVGSNDYGKGGAVQYEIIKQRAKPEWFEERKGGL